MANDKEEVDVSVIEHSNDDVTVNVVVKENQESNTVSKENTVANTTLNVDPNKVPVQSAKEYVNATYASSDLPEGSELYRTGEKELTLVLECGDTYVFNVEKLLAVVYRAADLSIYKDD